MGSDYTANQKIMIEFITMTDDSAAQPLCELMLELYGHEQPDPARRPGVERLNQSIRFLLANPQRGRIILFLEKPALVGYAILIPYFSNEFGGTLLFVDELLVTAGRQGRGIGGSFFRWLADQRPFDAVAVALEVNEQNHRARRFYSAIGFQPRRYTMMTLGLQTAS